MGIESADDNTLRFEKQVTTMTFFYMTSTLLDITLAVCIT